MTVIIYLFIPKCAYGAQFGILSETYVYPDGLRLDTDSKLFVWDGATALSDDTIDKREGEKSLKGVVGGSGWTGWGIIWDSNNDNNPDPKNMSAYSGGSLNFWVKTEINLKVGIKSGTITERWILLKDAPYSIPLDNQWRFVSIPFSSFSGIDFANVTQLFMVVNDTNSGSIVGKTYHFDNVKWNTANVGALHHINVSPTPWTMPTSMPKSFLAKGYDINNNERDIYPTWSALTISGTFSPAAGPLTVFTAGPSAASGSVTATDGGISGSASVTTQNITWNDFFNIFIDKGMYGSLGAYDSDDGNGDGDGIENNSIALATVTDVHPTSLTKSLRATYSITSIGWAGCFFQEGALTDTTSVKNLSDFSNGYLHFWAKSPVNLEVGLRTNNITSGTEKSKVRLSEYGIPADNTWREVYIALDDFKNRDARIDFTQSKIFVNTAVVGKYTGASSSIFYISDVKYVRRKEATPTLTVAIKGRNDHQPEPTNRITFSRAQLGGGWKNADQYFEIAYDTVNPSWGAQIYTDNMGPAASPSYSGDPTKYPDQQPTGLIGVSERFLNCPMAWMALDDTLTSTAAQLVVNPNTEAGSTAPTGWATYNNDLTTQAGWVTETSHSSNHSLKVVNTTRVNAGWSGQTVTLSQPYPTTLTFSGWAKAQNVSSDTSYFTFDFQIIYDDDTYIWFLTGSGFDKGTHDWQKIQITYTFDKPVKRIRPYCIFYNGTGTVWFDDIYATPGGVELPIPVEDAAGKYFDSDTGGMWGSVPAKSEWSWLKDMSSTRWSDTNANGVVDAGEMVADFSLTGDAYSTFIEPAGIATGWFNPDTTRVYILNPQSPLIVYLAAKFTKASVLQEYKTNTLTLELYHY